MLVKLMLALLVGCPGPVDGEGAVGGVVGEPSPVDVEPPVDPAEPGSSDDAAQPAQVSDADLEALVRGNNAFAFDLYRAAASGEDDLVLSPASVSVAMAMTWAGARGRTAEQMAEALHFELPQERLHPAMARLRSDLLDEVAGVELAVANRLWGQQGAAFLDPFLAVTRDSYGAQTVEADFAGDPEGVRADINRWVDEQTRHRIPDLLQPGTIEPLTRLVLANAIAFEGQWKFKFPAERTQPAPFTRTDGSQVQAPLMQVKLPTALYQGEGFQVLALPYQGDEVEMVVVLPEQHDGLAALEARVDGDTLQTWLGEATTGDVVVWLPRFEIAAGLSLVDAMQSLGMKEAFGMGADLSGMNGRQDLYISAAVHRAFVDVDEEGTEAAAATAVVVGRKSARPRLPQVRADHPFLFLVRHRATGSILFAGRLMDPT